MANDLMRAIVLLFALMIAQPAWAEAEGDHGRNVFKKCKSCHTFDKGGKHKSGPNLWAIVDADIAANTEKGIIRQQEEASRLAEEQRQKVMDLKGQDGSPPTLK